MGDWGTQWTPEKVEELKRRLADGQTMSEIAQAIGATRNAVIGKASRLGLSSRASTSRVTLEERKERDRVRAGAKASAERIRRARNREAVPIEPTPEPPTVQLGEMAGVPFADLRPFSSNGINQCRFIAAEPPGPEYRSCGAATPPGESYCGHCYRITRAVYANTQAERAEHIRMGTRQYLASRRRAA